VIPWLGDDPDAEFPPVARALRRPDGLLAAGGDLSVDRLLRAYRSCIFPWYSEGQPVLWWSPDPRCILPTRDVHVSRRTARRLRQGGFSLTMDRAFAEVIAACAEADRRRIASTMLDAFGERGVDARVYQTRIGGGAEVF
jgi:leucyl/phenylalanyl-tRNA--protein transferase